MYNTYTHLYMYILYINPEGNMCYSSRTLSFVLNQSSVGGFTGCCTVSSSGLLAPYLAFSSTEGRREETEAVSRVCGITTTSASVCLPRREQQQWEGVGGCIKRWNAASAAKLHPIECDFVSVARSNTLSTYIMFTAAPVYEQKHITIKGLSPFCCICSIASMRRSVIAYFMPVNIHFATCCYHLLYHNMN